MQEISLSELCEALSVSVATGRNWIAQGKLIPVCYKKKTPYFTKEYALAMRSRLADGQSSACKSRRNKTYQKGIRTVMSYLEPSSPNRSLGDCLSELSALDALSQDELVLYLKASSGYFIENELKKLLESSLSNNQKEQPESALLLTKALGIASALLDSYPKTGSPAKNKVRKSADRLCTLLPMPVYVPFEDTLGFLYLSLRQLNSRKSSGSYYTPPHVADRLLSELDFFPVPGAATNPEAAPGQGAAANPDTAPGQGTVLDPSCGTGSFLLRLPKEFPLSSIYGTDIDPIAVAIARVNLFLRQLEAHRDFLAKHPNQLLCVLSKDVKLLLSHIRVSDFLHDRTAGTYQYILGNPPWGADFSKKELSLLQRSFVCAGQSRPESYELFLEQAIRKLKPNGRLSFVLPESVLTVKAHAKIRELLLSATVFCSLVQLGNCFDGVYCPSILLTVKKAETAHPCLGMRVTTAGQTTFTIQTERSLSKDSLCLLSDDKSYTLLQKLLHAPNCIPLADLAGFALGIVTGNNQRALHPVKTMADDFNKMLSSQDTTPSGVREAIPVLQGTDIFPYHITPPTKELVIPVSQCQQTAPSQLYAAPEKLLYRFISNRLVFAYDTDGLLPLNSCNVLLPRSEEVSMLYLLALLNSRPLQFIFHELFHSVKVLRSQLEQLPIPIASKKEQEDILSLVDILRREPYASDAYQAAYEELDSRIASWFLLTGEEYSLILQSSSIVRNENAGR